MARGPRERDEMRNLLCFARGHEGSWEGLCVDYDIAVQGASFGQVQADLGVSRSLLKFQERLLLFKSYAASAI